MRARAALLIVFSGCATTPKPTAQAPITLTFAWPAQARFAVRHVQTHRVDALSGTTDVTRGELRFTESVTMSAIDRTRRIERHDLTVEPTSAETFRRTALLSELTVRVSADGELLEIEQSREAMARGPSILSAPKTLAERMAPMLEAARAKDVRTRWRDLVGLWNGRVITGPQKLKWAGEDANELLTEVSIDAERDVPCGATRCVRLHAVFAEAEASRETTRSEAEQRLQAELTGALHLTRAVTQYELVLVTDPATLVPSSLTSSRVIRFIGTLDGEPVSLGEERHTELTWQREE